MNKLAFSKPSGTDADSDVLFTRFRETGYDGLQLKAGQYMPYLDDPQRFIDTWGQYPGAASALICWCKLDYEGKKLLKKIIAFGRNVGTEMIVYCHNAPRAGMTIEELKGYAVELSEVGKQARDVGLAFSLHNHYDQPVMHRDDIEVFFSHVKNSTVGLTVDTAHLVKSGEMDVAGIIRDFRSVIDNFHLKDIENGEFRVLGTASIDFKPVFVAIQDIGYPGWISTDEESGADMAAAMQQCYDFMKAGLE